MKQKLTITAFLTVGIVLVINFLSNELHLRLDLTDDRQYTLSKATKNIISDLEEPVTVKAYFSENLPANVGKTRQDFQDLLVEYASRSNGMIVYEFINPNANEDGEKVAMDNGIQPLTINVREKDQVKQQKAYMGAVISMGAKEEAIPFVQPGAAMEYALSTAIKKISIDNKPTIGFLSGHGEPPLSEMAQIAQQLNVLYTLEEVRLDSMDIPTNMRTLVVIRPKDSIPAAQLRRIDDFMERGGRVLVAINRVTGDMQRSVGIPTMTGVESWLAAKGVIVQDAFIIDTKCAAVTVQEQMGNFTMQRQISFPFIPAISKFSGHPITSGLESVILEFASPVNYQGDTSKRFTAIAFSSGQSGVQPAPVYFNLNKQWTEAEFPQSSIPVAGILEGRISGTANSKMVVIGDGDLVVNGPREEQRRLQPDNVSLVSNAIDWLSDDTGLIELRSKGVTSRPIEELEDTTKNLLKYGNFLLPIFLAVAYGGIRWQSNRMKRLKRMAENYEED